GPDITGAIRWLVLDWQRLQGEAAGARRDSVQTADRGGVASGRDEGGWFRAKVGYPGGRERGWRGVMRVDEPPSALEGRLDTNVDSQLLYPRWLQRNVVPSTSVPTPGRSPVDPGTSPVVPSPPGR
ncbi:MAG: hypothetical protein ACK2VD_21270, partial [Anaerolineae bacterium]